MSVKPKRLDKINAVLFDLDGTLLDTAPDLAATLNELLLTQEQRPLLYSAIRPIISEGVAGLLKLGFNINKKDARFPALHKRFLAYYSQHSCKHTQLFPGVEALIHYLEHNKLAWGIVTNKSMALTVPLVNHFSLLKKARCIVAGDTLQHSKPHPEPLLHACECLGYLPKNCVYIGDAKRDVDAANAAGMHSIIALYGYIRPETDTKTWQGDATISTPLAVIDWLIQKS